ncbi:MAG: hypothetical protein RL722_944 [Pseudomonadota bacterium]|jgi:vitamin B12 transporter
MSSSPLSRRDGAAFARTSDNRSGRALAASLVAIPFSLSAAASGVLLLTAAPLALAQSAPAASAVGALAPVVITASRSEQALPDALPSTRVISREQIEQSQAADLPALLRQFTTIDIAQSGPAGSQTSLFLRGADSRQTLLVVDGVPMNRADLGSASWQHLAIDQIERVEIVRGNVSAVWGAQAIGGVVQVITRRAQRPEVTLGLGSQGSRQASVATGWLQPNADGTETRFSLAASRRLSQGFNATDPATGTNPDRDGLSQTAASLRLEQGWAPGHRTTLTASSVHDRSAYDGSYAFSFPPIDPLSRADSVATQVDAVGLSSRHRLSPQLDLQADLGQTREAYQDPTGPEQFGNASGSNQTRNAQLQLDLQVASGHRLIAAVEDKREQLKDSATPQTARSTTSLRTGWLGSYTLGGQVLDTQLSLRHDDNSRYGSARTGLLALGWSVAPGLKLSLQGGNAFSAPSFSQQQFAAPGVTLKPERSRNLEAAAQWTAGAGHSLRLAWFRQRQSDRIASNAAFENVNIAHARNQGVEALGQWQLARGTTLSGEALWQNPRDADSGQALKRRARQTQALSLGQELGALDLGASLRHQGARADVDPVTFADATAPARTTLALSAGWRISPAWKLAAKLDNATDTKRPEVLGYTPAPRSLNLSLSGRL